MTETRHRRGDPLDKSLGDDVHYIAYSSRTTLTSSGLASGRDLFGEGVDEWLRSAGHQSEAAVGIKASAQFLELMACYRQHDKKEART